MLTVVMTSMPAASSSSTSSHRLSVAAAGHVRVGQFVDERHGGSAGEHRVDVELLEVASR